MARSPWPTLVAVAVGSVMTGVDGTALTIAGPDLATDLGASVTGLSWVANAYLLATALALLPAGALADRFGRRAVFLCGVTGFTLVSLALALADSVWLVITLRAVQGLFSALLQPAALALLRAAFPPRLLGLAVGVWGAVAALGLAAGPLLGGLLVAAGGWRAIFLVNLPVGALAVLLAALLVAESRAPRALRPRAVLDLVRPKAFQAGVALVAVVFGALFGVLFLLTLFLQDLRGLDPVTAGLWLMPVTGIVVLSAPLGGAVTKALGPLPPTAAGLVLLAAGLFAMAGLDAGSGAVEVALATCPVGLGGGLALVAATEALLATAPPSAAGLASAVQQVAGQLGGLLGIAVVGALLTAGSGFTAGLHTAVVVAGVLVIGSAPLAVLLRGGSATR
ncbi:putative MFS family arabinose efflux permease [Crossiella equi]|uniref:MFS family arabinose efflux permease n=1 Tax=Crossiella equi TaxID=130796 RepID=A0ABS5AIV2_9PSEU|nr:MFS transporter [Crossiella equi]MBP2476512.1 putative MFS family arabinose efflux permease [Crossiella equi]